MSSKNDISNLEDVITLVNDFYVRVRADELLSPIFETLIQDRWEAHLEKMYKFWQTVLLHEHTYFGSPFPPHALMPINKLHFERWLLIFNKTVEDNFSGHLANRAKWQGERMAEVFLSKITYYQNSSSIPLV